MFLYETIMYWVNALKMKEEITFVIRFFHHNLRMDNFAKKNVGIIFFFGIVSKYVQVKVR